MLLNHRQAPGRCSCFYCDIEGLYSAEARTTVYPGVDHTEKTAEDYQRASEYRRAHPVVRKDEPADVCFLVNPHNELRLAIVGDVARVPTESV